uniref:PWWP domain-containing protein n=1 Tax=Kalanchoe fedtschenkoi TaxID=63787 RepID=A0A7N0T402_KALFE
MAPNRRKSKASSAAAAAAVQKKWKVGDLVLAKVKGFPVWPATVSEPEKWGYKPDSKKVLVFFFGTNQIAFCSHADVEAFTDEKKQSVHGKRYGKSADFVRAVNEIIESYDKLKTQAQDHDLNCGVEAAVTNGENSVGSLVNPGTTDPMSNDSGPLIHQLHNGSVSTMDKFEGSPPFDDAASVMDENRNSSYIISISGTPVGRSHVLRKKHGAVNSLANVNQRWFPSTGRSRTSRANANRQQDNELPSVDSVAGTGNIVLCRGSPRDANTGMSTLGDEKLADSPLQVPNSSPEDSTSGIASQECNSNNMTEGSSFNSSCLPEQTGTAGNLNENVGLTKRHGLDIKAVFVKKKRKPNRKRFATDSQELTSSVDNADLIIGVHNYRLNSPNACEKSNESPSKVDCDEYLPLVKRARVRMGKLSDVGGHVDALMVDVKEKSTNGCYLDVSNGLSMNSFNKHSSNEQDVIMMKEPTGDPLTQPDSSILANGDQPDNLCKGSPCDKEDGEGGLPPSVHVHSAFETISVNVTKDYQPHAEGQICNSLAVIAGSISSLAEAGATVTGSDVGEDMLGANVNAACNNEIEVKLLNDTAVANPLRPSESKIPLIETAETNQCSEVRRQWRKLELVMQGTRHLVLIVCHLTLKSRMIVLSRISFLAISSYTTTKRKILIRVKVLMNLQTIN